MDIKKQEVEEESRMKLFCFVIMPFGGGDEYEGSKSESDYVFKNVIKPAVIEIMGQGDENKVRIFREVEKHTPGNIPADIIKNLAEADVVIADLTGRNPNVYLELGIRFTFKNSGTVLMMQKGGKLPFNIGHMRSVFYSTKRWDDNTGRKELSSALSKMYSLIESDKYPGDSPVREIFPDLAVCEEGIGVGSDNKTMPWSVYWNQMERTLTELGDFHRNGNFNPDLIVGISNGGLIFADIISRQSYSNAVPFLTLWAHRPHHEDYFNHPIGEILTKDLLENLGRSMGKEHEPPYKILLIDDIIGSTRTIRQAIKFIKDSLGNVEVQITCFVLFSKASKEQLEEIEEFFPNNHPEQFVRSRFYHYIDGLRTRYELLPYHKEIHGDLQFVEAEKVV
jgi:hypoxanthine phosphoribosyltransferase